MTITQQSAKHLREVFFGGNWTWSNVKDQLSDVDLDMATYKLDGFNTIAVLTFHIGYYVRAVLSVLEDQPLNASDKFSFDLPPLESAAQWNALVAQTLSNAEKAAGMIAQLPDSRLEAIFVEEKYGTWFRNIHGLIEHTHYHLGQIAIIKKMYRTGLGSPKGENQ